MELCLTATGCHLSYGITVLLRFGEFLADIAHFIN